MHLSPELEWAQFLVIMIVGFMLLYDCVLNRKHARKMEGLLIDGEDPLLATEGMAASDIKSMAIKQTSSNNTCRSDTGNSDCGDDSRLLENMMGSMEAPVYYPTLSVSRAERRAKQSARLQKEYRKAQAEEEEVEGMEAVNSVEQALEDMIYD